MGVHGVCYRCATLPRGERVVNGYVTTQELEQRLEALEQAYHRLRLAKASVMRLQDGDTLIMRVPRPLASSEQKPIVEAFQQLIAKHGKRAEFMLICGHDEVQLDVVRAG